MTYRRATRPAGPASRPPHRRSDADLRKLARDTVTGHVLVTNNDQVIKSAFYMIAALFDWRRVDADNLGALIGYMSDVVPGRAMNGYPIFWSMGFLHKDDVPIFDGHLAQMREALQ